jgi:RNA polymerase sigma-70 factor (family 1)
MSEKPVISFVDDLDMLFGEWHAPLVYYAFRYTSDQASAEDIVEESFIRLWEKKASFDNPKILKSYLYSTVRNASLNWLKAKKRAGANELALAYTSEAFERPDAENLIRAEVLREVYAAINLLPPQCRKVYEMMYIDGKSARQVSEELHLSVDTVKYHNAHGLSLLRKKLAGFFTAFVLLLLI